MRLVMRLYLLWPRLELAFVSILPLGLIVESSIANSSAYGFAGFASAAAIAASVVALLRGFLFELLTYVSTRTVAIMVRKGAREHALPLGIMAVLSFFLILVSAVNNLGWVLSGHDLRGLFALLGSLLPSIIYKPYQIGLAVLLPLAVGGIALVDLDHFVHDLLEKDAMDDHAVLVEERIMHRTGFLKGQRAQKQVIEEAYQEIAADRAREQIERVRSGDISFGAGTSTRSGALTTGQPTRLLGPSGGQGWVAPADSQWNGHGF
ncbi:MAG TPA: hypothetical protein VKX46_05800 [Ktedonobacteraceae bacterium]|nr:hypothetical protein [Ktedonobacteraceae bacterium]